MTVRPDRPRWQRFRRWERGLALGYLGAVAVLLVSFALPPIRQRLLGGLQHALRTWDDRWSRRVEAGEAMVQAGEYTEAAAYLARLDEEFPARDVRHARDKERERLLVALGRSYTELGRKQRAIETYQKLVAFDTHNYRNYYALGVVSNRLLAGWAPAPEARDAFVQALRLNPSHLPSVRGAIAFYSARGEFAEVVTLYQAYLDSYLRQDITVSLGDARASVAAPVDGETHEYDVRLARPAGWSGSLRLSADGFSLGVAGVTLVSPLQVGVARPGIRRELPGVAPAAAAEHSLTIASLPEALSLIHLRIAVFKPVDPSTWQMVVPAYRNLLNETGLAAARARTVVLPSVAAADSVLRRPAWATAGLGRGADDTRY